MRVDSVKDARLMSDLAAPEASAGITLALLDDEAQPVVKMLGIECEMNGARDDNGMVRIKPVMPFWVQMDVAMGCASRQVWRTPWSGWTENIDTPSLNEIEPIDYVELGSGAGDELCAPFNIPTWLSADEGFAPESGLGKIDRADKRRIRRKIRYRAD